jgi:hypothetical protein
MSKADEILKELGYCVDVDRTNIYIYAIDDNGKIKNFYTYHKKSKFILIDKFSLSKEEQQAINKKIEELG